MQALLIILWVVAASISYGILHDQITARICVEYFTIGHPPLIASESPTLLALAWGVVASWWVGLFFGALLAVAARIGHRPKRSVSTLVRPVLLLLAVTAAFALLAGALGNRLAHAGAVVLLEPLASRVPSTQHVPFLTALWAHNASYLAGSLGGLILVIHTWRSRRLVPDARNDGT